MHCKPKNRRFSIMSDELFDSSDDDANDDDYGDFLKKEDEVRAAMGSHVRKQLQHLHSHPRLDTLPMFY